MAKLPSRFATNLSCATQDVKRAILSDLMNLAKKEGLLSFEMLKDIYLHPDAFTIDNGLLTPTLKAKA